MIQGFLSTSSFIESVSFNFRKNVLTIFMRSGETYRYADVPADVYTDMFAGEEKGESLGAFYHANVKGKYSFTKR